MTTETQEQTANMTLDEAFDTVRPDPGLTGAVPVNCGEKDGRARYVVFIQGEPEAAKVVAEHVFMSIQMLHARTEQSLAEEESTSKIIT